MEVEISNIQQQKGAVLVALYNKEQGFLDPASAVFKQVYSVTSTGKMVVQLPVFSEGEYAISSFHDLNGNNRLDQNIFGVPTEPYGFSLGVRPQFRAPTWSETRFWFKSGRIQVRLANW